MHRNIKLLFVLLSFPLYSAYSQGWSQLATTGGFTARANGSAVYINSQNKIYVFGGSVSNGSSNELWSLDLSFNTWEVVPSNSTQQPASRATHVCMYDSLLNRLLVWSGQGAALYNDVWAFNFADSTWDELFVDGNVLNAPLKRYGVAAAFDPVNRNIINFAGFTTSGRFDDTWGFNVDNQVWTDHTNTHYPLMRCLASAAFADDRREMIIFGGQNTGNLNDIWKLDVDSYTWTDLTPSTNPAARHFSSIVYCGDGNVIVFGGNSLNQGNAAGGLSDLWEFSLNDNQWYAVPQAGLKPEPRFGHAAVYIPETDKMIIIGGQGVSALLNDVWVYDGISDVINGIKGEDEMLDMVKCYPNPVKSNLYIEQASHRFSSVSIFDVHGKKVSETAVFGQSASIDFSALNSGVYTLVLETTEKRLFKKIIKMD